MAKIKNPIRFSDHFGIDEKILLKQGVLNPSLCVDTKLFIDPFLLPSSQHTEISEGACKTFEEYFEFIIRLLKGSNKTNDTAWRAAKRLMTFPEIKWTCLGYGAQSVSGAGSGGATTDAIIQTAKEIVDLGTDDPDLFVALGVFEEGIGPDRISDMTANVILPDLLKFNDRILKTIKVPTKPITLNLKNGKSYTANLPVNPYEINDTAIILVPSDILRKLPIVRDWSDVAGAAAKNATLRQKVNEKIADIWCKRTLKEKDKLRRWAMSSQNQFETFLELLKGASPKPYDMIGDPIGELVWKRISQTIASDHPFDLPPTNNIETVIEVVEKIIKQFQFLIEKRRLSEELYHQGKQRPEKAAQRLFFAVAYAYCKSNNLDLTPEADTGNGPVDFKMSYGFEGKVIVEIKLSTNNKLVDGYSKQLKTYEEAEETTYGYYVVINVGNMGKKFDRLIERKNAESAKSKRTSEIYLINGIKKKSASKL